MHITHKLGLTLLTLGALGLSAAHPASAAPSVASLNGAYYHAPTGSVSSVAESQSYINTHGASGYFTATQATLALGYSGHDDSLITSFLGTDGASYVGTVGNMSDGILNLTGSVIVTTPGSYTFSTTSDDGSALFIDGSSVVNNDSLHLSNTATGTVNLGAGQHSVSVVYFDHGFLPSQNGLANFSANFGGLAVTPAPEPSSVAAFALTGLGVLGSALKARKRRVSA